MTSWSKQSKNTASWENQKRNGVVPAGVFDIARFDESMFDTTVKQVTTEWTNQSKNSASFNNDTKNTTDWVNLIRRGKTQTMADLGDYTFNNEVLINGSKMREVKISDLDKTEWANQSKS